MSQKRHNEIVKIKKVLDESYKTLHIDGIYSMCNESFGQIMPYYDEPILEFDAKGQMEVTTIQRHFVVDLRMSPHTFKKIAFQLHSSIEEDGDEIPEKNDEIES